MTDACFACLQLQTVYETDVRAELIEWETLVYLYKESLLVNDTRKMSERMQVCMSIDKQSQHFQVWGLQILSIL